jgi:hypothetical protein
MAGIAGITFVNISRFIIVLISQVSRVIVLVTLNATESGEITGIGMAFIAGVPGTVVLT